MSSIQLAIKLGSTTTTIFRQGDGLVLREPSLIAVSGQVKSREVKGIGFDAHNLLGRDGNGVSVVSPIEGGLINNAELAILMLRGFVNKVCPDRLFKPNIKALICVPLGLSNNDKKIFQKVCYSAGIHDVTLFPAILCTGLGLNLKIDDKYGKLLVNIGGGCTNIAVVANNTILSGVSLSIGGTNLNTAIKQYVLEKYNLQITDTTSEKIKHDVASLYQSYSVSMEINGIDKSTLQAKSATISSAEIYPILDYNFSKICEAIESVINSCAADIITDIYKLGGYFSGSQIIFPGLEKYLKRKLNMQVFISETAKTDIWGASKLLDDPLKLKKLILAN